MFRTNATRTTLVVLTVSALALTFASGCINEVSGPTAAAAPTVSEPISRTPVEIASKAEIAVESAKPGDLTGDGFVDASDLAYFAYFMRADVTLDGRIDSKDQAVFTAILSHQVPDLVAPEGVVDGSDFAAFAAAMPRADVYPDGRVDATDVAFLAWIIGRLDQDGDGKVTPGDRPKLDVAPPTP